MQGNGGKQQQHDISQRRLHFADDESGFGYQRGLQQVVGFALALAGDGAGGQGRDDEDNQHQFDEEDADEEQTSQFAGDDHAALRHAQQIEQNGEEAHQNQKDGDDGEAAQPAHAPAQFLDHDGIEAKGAQIAQSHQTDGDQWRDGQQRRGESQADEGRQIDGG